jgi:hypothetical protein
VLSIGSVPEAEWAARAEARRRFGVPHLLIDTGVSARSRDPSLNTVGSQVEALRRINEALELTQHAQP